MYLATCTRPDIAYAVSHLSQFNTCFNREHWTAAKRVLRYLKGTSDLGLTYTKNEKSIEGFVDADWTNCSIDRRSYSGFAFTLSGCPISWESRKQKTVALSSTEAEYMALSEAAKQATYLIRLLSAFGIPDVTIKIFCDNNGAIKLAENPVFHARSKHIDIRHHFVREVLNQGAISVAHISTTDMASDFLTKALPASKFKKCLSNLGLSRQGFSS